MAEKENPFDTYHLTPTSYDHEGYPVAEAPFTDTADTKRHAIIAPPEKVIPVILVPGTMGSNLRLTKLPEGFAEKRYTDGVKPDPWSFPPVKRTTTGWGDKAWAPDDGATFMAQRYYTLNAFERRRLLDPENTKVDDRAEVNREYALKNFVFESTGDGKKKEEMAEQRRLGFLKEMKRRGWSSVFQKCYVPLLAFLEHNLNSMFYFGELNYFWQTDMIAGSQGGEKKWSIIKGVKALTDDDVKKAARYWLPVHAVGYNWIQSNTDSAKHLLGKIKEFTDHFKKMGYECEKVILVTHSMGGLVARAAVHPELGQNVDGAADKILGVIHGVMPTQGAGTAYRRCHAGFEGASVGAGFNVASRILGKNGPEVTAIFSGSPGALQLLPNKLYGPGWLKITDGNGKVIKALPEADPYKEIYEQKDVWWRLMNPEWIDPAPGLTPELQRLAWAQFVTNSRSASVFHDKLGATHHPHTFIQYSADDKTYKASGTVTWAPPKRAASGNDGFVQSTGGATAKGGSPFFGGTTAVSPGDPTTSRDFSESDAGEVTLNDILLRGQFGLAPTRMSLAPPADPGDGTVPQRSARGIDATVEMVAAHNPGYDHQGAYETDLLQQLTTYGIARLVGQYMP